MKYFGKYEDFTLASERDAGNLIGADNAVGDIYDIELDIDEGIHTARLVNRFGKTIGRFDTVFSNKLALMAADGMVEKAILSYVAFTNKDAEGADARGARNTRGGEGDSAAGDEGLSTDSKVSNKGDTKRATYAEYGHYWGNVAVICYDEAHCAAFESFTKNVAARIADDVRPRIDLENDAIDKIIESDGAWTPKQTIALPDMQKGMTFIKRRRRMAEKLVDQGRAGNKGCYILSWIFIIALVVGVVFAIKTLVGL